MLVFLCITLSTNYHRLLIKSIAAGTVYRWLDVARRVRFGHPIKLMARAIMFKHMKILSLNVLDAKLRDALQTFLESQLGSTDAFCFQETLGPTIETLLAELFPSELYTTIWAEKTTNGDGQYNLCTVVKKPLQVPHSQTILAPQDKGTGQALASKVVSPDDRTFTVVNVHGAPYPGDKLDTEGRLRQSDAIIHWLGEHSSSPAIICGDFNLLPETEAVKKFARAGYQDLIADYKIPTTRNELAWKNWPDTIQLFADYTFVSPELNVTGFSVPNAEASDHLPMITTIDY